jgi:hypothetical protein
VSAPGTTPHRPVDHDAPDHCDLCSKRCDLDVDVFEATGLNICPLCLEFAAEQEVSCNV